MTTLEAMMTPNIIVIPLRFLSRKPFGSGGSTSSDTAAPPEIDRQKWKITREIVIQNSLVHKHGHERENKLQAVTKNNGRQAGRQAGRQVTKLRRTGEGGQYGIPMI